MRDGLGHIGVFSRYRMTSGISMITLNYPDLESKKRLQTGGPQWALRDPQCSRSAVIAVPRRTFEGVVSVPSPDGHGMKGRCSTFATRGTGSREYFNTISHTMMDKNCIFDAPGEVG